MGSGLQKSTKMASDMSRNLNANSVGITAGTKGSDKKQKVKTKSKPKTKTTSKNKAGASKKKGCGTCLVWTSVVFAIFLFALILFAGIGQPELTGIDVTWNATEYDINATADITISPIPDNAKIKTLALSENNIASLKYEDGIATVSFKAEGNKKLYFIANEKIISNAQRIQVVDYKAELERLAAEQDEAERIAAEQAAQAEAERIAAEQAAQAEAERIAAEQAAQAEAERVAAEQAAQAEAKRVAAEQAAAQAQNPGNNFNTYDNASQQQTTSRYVLNTNTLKFHYPTCRDVRKIAPKNYSPSDASRDSIKSQGYSPCGHCNP